MILDSGGWVLELRFKSLITIQCHSPRLELGGSVADPDLSLESEHCVKFLLTQLLNHSHTSFSSVVYVKALAPKAVITIPHCTRK